MQSEKISVVVADDDQETANMVAEMLSSSGYAAVVAYSAYEALGHLADNQHRVIVSDIRMKGLNGVDLLLRANAQSNADLDVILMSGWSTLSEQEAMAMGSYGLLDKPFDAEQLVRLVGQASRRLEDRWSADGKLPKSGFRLDDRVVVPDCQSDIAFGRSGMFVPMPSGSLPEEGAIVDLALTTTSVGPVNGLGRVRWVRDHANGQLPRGIGMEYVSLSDMTRQSLVRNLRETRNMACIPLAPARAS